MEEYVLCPFLSTGGSSVERWPCLPGRCGLYDRQAGCCAITAISLRLGKLAPREKEHKNRKEQST